MNGPLVLAAIAIYLIYNVLSGIKFQIKRKKHKTRIEELFQQIKQEDLESLRKDLGGLLDQFKAYQITLRDKNGHTVNICPKCFGVFRPVNSSHSKGKFLGCSNYPICRSYGDIKKLKNLDAQWQI